MSLLFDFMEDVVMLDKVSSPDGNGGTYTEWKEGAEFKASITKDNTIQAMLAEKQDAIGVYLITVSRNIEIEAKDVIRRKSDGKVFRVTTDGKDSETPKSAQLDMRQVRAEEWRLPT